MTSDVLLTLALLAAAGVSLAVSGRLVRRLESLAGRFGLSEAVLGLLAAAAADAPEVTTAVTALVRHQRTVGVGVVLGANVFQLATLLGLTAVVAGRVRLHRRVVLFAGTVAVVVAAASVAVVARAVPPAAGLGVAVATMAGALAVSESRGRLRWGRLARALAKAAAAEEAELAQALHPRRPRRGDAAVAGGALAVVVAASVAMEAAATALGRRAGVPDAVVGAVVLAAVTSLPNAVAAVYLGRRGRGAATLAEALNSNTLNATFGLLVPAVVVGIAAPSGPVALAAGWYAGLTVLVLALAYAGRGLRRGGGTVVLVGYAVFVAVLVARA